MRSLAREIADLETRMDELDAAGRDAVLKNLENLSSQLKQLEQTETEPS